MPSPSDSRARSEGFPEIESAIQRAKPGNTELHKANDGLGTAVAQNTMREMVAEVTASPSLYRPSKFWVDLNEINQTMLDELGVENLKRTLAQNYFNWLVTSRQDPQYQAVRRLWKCHPTLRPYLNRLEEPKLLKTLQPYLAATAA